MDYIAALESAIGKKAKMKLLPLQPGDLPETYADMTDFIECFNYKPSTPVELGINNFVVWYRNYFKV